MLPKGIRIVYDDQSALILYFIRESNFALKSRYSLSVQPSPSYIPGKSPIPRNLKIETYMRTYFLSFQFNFCFKYASDH